MEGFVRETDEGAREKFTPSRFSPPTCARGAPVLLPRVSPSSQPAAALRWSALAVLLGGLGTWLGTGAHLGFTQTSLVTMRRDEITGIDYPERRPGFVAGIEVPLGTAGAAVALALLSLAADRRAAR